MSSDDDRPPFTIGGYCPGAACYATNKQYDYRKTHNADSGALICARCGGIYRHVTPPLANVSGFQAF